MGRMTKDRYGFSGPVGTSLFCEPPFHIRDSENLLIFYEADAEAVTDILPEGVELLSTPPIVQVLVNKTIFSNAGPHYGTYIFPQCQFEGKPYTFEYFLMVTTDVAMASGREFWGDSKKLCHTDFVWEANEVFSTVERPKGLRLVTTHFRIERMAAPEDLPEMHPGLCLKMIPSSEEGAPLCVHQYVQDALDFVPAVGADGKPELYSGTGSIMMDMETEVWPIYRLKPLKMLSAFYIRGSFDLSYGKILKDFK